MLWLASTLGVPRRLPREVIESRRQFWEDTAFTASVWRYYEDVTRRTDSI